MTPSVPFNIEAIIGMYYEKNKHFNDIILTFNVIQDQLDHEVKGHIQLTPRM